MRELLETIANLSHEFGSPDFVKGGGGNTSCKTADTLWIKASGTTLAGLTAESLIEMDRARLKTLHGITPPSDAKQREALVKRVMEESRALGVTGRASVEAPLHNCLDYTYVVHTHPYLVNALTCGKQGALHAKRLFPEALWIDYIDPGYTLCIFVERKIAEYAEQVGHHPQVIVLKNHGIFVAANTADGIREIYAKVFKSLDGVIGKRPLLPAGKAKGSFVAEVKAAMPSGFFFEDCATFELFEEPLTPDHIVYMKSYAHRGSPTRESVKAFEKAKGYAPRIFLSKEGVVSAADSQKQAGLAMELAQDAALIRLGAEHFGGIVGMTPGAISFIENWEVEAYRQKQMA